jgi:hypothetical protein
MGVLDGDALEIASSMEPILTRHCCGEVKFMASKMHQRRALGRGSARCRVPEAHQSAAGSNATLLPFVSTKGVSGVGARRASGPLPCDGRRSLPVCQSRFYEATPPGKEFVMRSHARPRLCRSRAQILSRIRSSRLVRISVGRSESSICSVNSIQLQPAQIRTNSCTASPMPQKGLATVRTEASHSGHLNPDVRRLSAKSRFRLVGYAAECALPMSTRREFLNVKLDSPLQHCGERRIMSANRIPSMAIRATIWGESTHGARSGCATGVLPQVFSRVRTL